MSGRAPLPTVQAGVIHAGAATAASAAEDARNRVRGLALVALAAVIWSSGGLIVRSLETADSWTTVFWRSATACVFLLAFMFVRDGRQTFAHFRHMGLAGVFVGICFGTASVALVIALNLTSVANTLILLSCAPLVAALLGRVVLGEAVRARTWVAIGACVLGISLMVSGSHGRGALAGDMVALLIAVAFAAGVVTIRRHRSVRMTPAVCLGTVIGMLVSAPLASPLAVSGSDFALLVLFGAGQLGVGLALFVAGARLASAAEVALLAMLEPILGPMWVWWLLNERPSDAALAGGAVVLAALIIHTVLDQRRARVVPPVV